MLDFIYNKIPFDEIWYHYLTGEWRVEPPKWYQFYVDVEQKIYKILPSDPHCVECGMPMAGLGGALLRFNGSKPSSFSSMLCSGCERLARKKESGAEIELSMLFADVRDSTPLSERTPTTEYKALIQRFYKETSHVLVHHNSMVNRLMGDQVSGLFVPRFAGKDHAKVAIEAAKAVLEVTGHGSKKGPWIPVGVGVHTGRAFVGAVGSGDGVNEIAVLGSAANLCARLSSRAAAGEILVSDESAKLAEMQDEAQERRVLVLKGISEKVPVRVMTL
ncbi:MAG: adenylate/guanylate cyclase domain-containing protein [Anaerolineales bacterium]|jgi:adenylate cyclase